MIPSFSNKRPLTDPESTDATSQKRRKITCLELEEAFSKIDEYMQSHLPQEILSWCSLETFIYSGKAFYIAILEKNLTLLSSLLKVIPDCNVQDEAGDTPLMFACKIGYLEGVQELINKKANPFIANQQGKFPLQHFVKKNTCDNANIINFLKKLSPQFLEKIIPKLLPICSSRKLLKFFIEHQGEINCTDSKGFSALTRAIKNCNLKAIALLLDHGAKLNFSQTFHSLAHFKQIETFTLLAKYDGSINSSDSNGDNPLMIYCEGCQKNALSEEHILQLINLGCSPLQKNNYGKCPLEIIAAQRLLPEHQILSILKQSSKEEILQLGSLLHYSESKELIDFFVQKGISIDLFNERGFTSLYLATERLDLSLIKILLSHHADPTLEKSSHFTIAQAASPLALISAKITMLEKGIATLEKEFKSHLTYKLKTKLYLCQKIQSLFTGEDCSSSDTEKLEGS